MRKKVLIVVCALILCVCFFLYRLYQPVPITPGDLNSPVSITDQTKPLSDENWKLFTSDTFSILLPSIPQHVSEKVPLSNSNDLITYDMYLVQQPVGSTFMISLINYPDYFDTSNPQNVLDAITKEMLSNNTDSHLVSSIQGEFLNKPAVENVIASESLFVFMKAFLSKKVLFVINVVDQQQDRAKKNFEKALNSFHLHDSE